MRQHPGIGALEAGDLARIDESQTVERRYAPVAEEDFRTAVGGVVEVEYLFNPWLGLKLRGVFERYESKLNLPTVSGNHVGLVLNFYF